MGAEGPVTAIAYIYEIAMYEKENSSCMLQFLTIKSMSHHNLSSYSCPSSDQCSFNHETKFLLSVSGYSFATKNIFLAKFWFCCKVKSVKNLVQLKKK